MKVKAMPYNPGLLTERDKELAKYGNKPQRFCIVDVETGEILDDAQGWGYKTAQKAHAAWAYKNQSKSERETKEAKQKKAKAWLKAHPKFVEAMDQFYFEIELKGSWGPDDKFDAKFVKEMLKDWELETDGITPGELLRAWKKM